jgi:peptidoglycan-associated lipoprotein
MKHLVAALTMSLAISACATTKKVAEKEPNDPTAYDAARAQAMDTLAANFARVGFTFDSVEITESTRNALADNVEIMRVWNALGVEVEGHCDEAGSTEYNLALGQRRAEAIRKYMVTAGIAGFRVRTISYGEERPYSYGASEDAMSQNRRAEFRITVDPSHEVRGTVADTLDVSVENQGPIALSFE